MFGMAGGSKADGAIPWPSSNGYAVNVSKAVCVGVGRLPGEAGKADVERWFPFALLCCCCCAKDAFVGVT